MRVYSLIESTDTDRALTAACGALDGGVDGVFLHSPDLVIDDSLTHVYNELRAKVSDAFVGMKLSAAAGALTTYDTIAENWGMGQIQHLPGAVYLTDLQRSDAEESIQELDALTRIRNENEVGLMRLFGELAVNATETANDEMLIGITRQYARAMDTVVFAGDNQAAASRAAYILGGNKIGLELPAESVHVSSPPYVGHVFTPLTPES